MTDFTSLMHLKLIFEAENEKAEREAAMKTFIYIICILFVHVMVRDVLQEQVLSVLLHCDLFNQGCTEHAKCSRLHNFIKAVPTSVRCVV